MSRSIPEKKLGAGRVVAVAIENNKTSQYAAKWAVDNLLPKDQHLLLVHVRQKASSIPTPSNSQTPQKAYFTKFSFFIGGVGDSNTGTWG